MTPLFILPNIALIPFKNNNLKNYCFKIKKNSSKANYNLNSKWDYFYLKVQYAHADLTISGATGSDSLQGWGGGIGLKTFFDKNTFIQAEANYTEYDTVSGRNVTRTQGGGAGTTTTTVSGTPYLAQGIISIGYQF